MLINELFAKTVNWRWHEESFANCFAVFTSNDIRYEVSFEKLNNYPPQWLVEFMAADAPIRQQIGFGIINSKNQFEVFSTVIAIIKDFAQKHPNTFLKFSANEPSRKALYRRLVKRLAKEQHWITHPDDGSDSEAYEIFLK